MKISRPALKRLTWLIQKKINESDLSVPIDVLAGELAEGFCIYFRWEILGERKSRVVTIDTPDGPWQSLKACLGLPHRLKTVVIDGVQLFPDLPALTYCERN